MTPLALLLSAAMAVPVPPDPTPQAELLPDPSTLVTPSVEPQERPAICRREDFQDFDAFVECQVAAMRAGATVSTPAPQVGQPRPDSVDLPPRLTGRSSRAQERAHAEAIETTNRQQRIGMGLGIAGLVTMSVGGGLYASAPEVARKGWNCATLPDYLIAPCTQDVLRRVERRANVGITLMVAGAATAVVGLVLGVSAASARTALQGRIALGPGGPAIRF